MPAQVLVVIFGISHIQVLLQPMHHPESPGRGMEMTASAHTSFLNFLLWAYTPFDLTRDRRI
jgi:hypothetical protein